MCYFRIMSVTISLDSANNRLYVIDKRVMLKLASEAHSRHLATIDIKNKSLMVIRGAKHLLRKADSYGFNYEMLTTAKKCNKVKLLSAEGLFDIPIEIILQKGSFLWFKTEGFERQIFLPRSVIKNFAVEVAI